MYTQSIQKVRFLNFGLLDSVVMYVLTITLLIALI